MSHDPIAKTTAKLWNSNPISGSSSSTSLNALILGSVVFAAIVLTRLNARRTHSVAVIPYKRGIPFIGSWSFFSRRYRFLSEGLRELGRTFRFNILHHTVVVVSGEEARRVFFGSKDLSLNEGFKILRGGVPELSSVGNEGAEHADDMIWYAKRLNGILKKERLAVMIPLMIADVDRAMISWDSRGQLDPFDKIYKLVFQLTIRASSCHEVANSQSRVARVTELFRLAERGSTASAILLPWLPSKSRKLKKYATTELYEIFRGAVLERQTSGKKEIDALQLFLDEGDGVDDIVQFILETLFAGIMNTGIMSCWMLLFLHSSPTWKSKAIAEVRSVISKYASPSSPSSSSAPTNLAARLSAIPPDGWDKSMPTLDLCLRETMRIVMTGAGLRRVMTDDVVVNGVKLERGSFLSHFTNNVHEDPEVYDEPKKWDPSRYERGDDKRQHWAFLGWGAGRHPCLGKPFAKLEVKVILAFFLMQYEYELVDGQGRNLTSVPEPCRDNFRHVSPSEPVFVKYERVEE